MEHSSQIAQLAKQKFTELQTACVNIQNSDSYSANNLPDIISSFSPSEFAKLNPNTQILFNNLTKLPKGVLQHVHLICCQDQGFFHQHILNDERIYVNLGKNQFQVGNATNLELGPEWINLKQDFNTKQPEQKSQIIQKIMRVTMFTPQQLQQYKKAEQPLWSHFQAKILAFLPLLRASHILKKYLLHIFEKFIKNGYQRVQFRGALTPVTEFDEEGNIIMSHTDLNKYTQIFDSALSQIRSRHSFCDFSAGIIIFGMKQFSREQNLSNLSKMLSTKWNKIIGIDFVQQEDLFPALQQYDNIAEQLIASYPEMHLKKIYHAGETNDHKNTNVVYAIKANSYRIGHGINIIQHPDYLADLKNPLKTCFEMCPVSNVFLGYLNDFRKSIGPLLHSLKIAITLNCDDPGTFGYQDCTLDYYMAAISYNWGLEDLKQIGLNSIRYAVVDEETREQMEKRYEEQYLLWMTNFLKGNSQND